jgi:hypothetical protein
MCYITITEKREPERESTKQRAQQRERERARGRAVELEVGQLLCYVI